MKSIVFLLLLGLYGCYTAKEITYEEYRRDMEREVVSIIKTDNSIVSMRGSSNYKAADTGVFSFSQSKKNVNIPLNEIKSFKVKEFDTAKTIFFVIPVIIGIAAYIVGNFP